MEAPPPSIDVFTVVEKLSLPKGSYMVFGSGILSALGIRESADVDLLVTEELFEKLAGEGWTRDSVEIEGRKRDRISQGDVEAFKEFWCDGIDYDIPEFIARAYMVRGIPFMPLEDLTRLKRSMGRPKDLEDIRRIEEYLQRAG